MPANDSAVVGDTSSGGLDPPAGDADSSPPLSQPPASTTSRAARSASLPLSSPPGNGTGTLWRQNTELRQRNQELEQEVQSLRRDVARRRLTGSSLGSSAATSRRASGLEPAAPLPSMLLSDSADDAMRVAVLEAQLAEAQRSSAAAHSELAAVRAEAAVAGAGIHRLSGQLSDMRAAAEQLREQLGAAMAEGQRREDEAVRLQQQLAEARAALAAAKAQQLAAAPACPRQEDIRPTQEQPQHAVAHEGQGARAGQKKAARASTSRSPSPSRTASPRYARPPSPHSAALPPLLAPGGCPESAVGCKKESSHPPAHAFYSLELSAPASPGSSSQAAVEAAAAAQLERERQQLEKQRQLEMHYQLAKERQHEQEMAGLRERLRVAEAELASQLAEKQAARLALSASAAELAALRSERELLQEQAVSLQQEVSGMQAAEGSPLPLERSPSRTLASRMKEMLSPRKSALGSRAGSRGGSPPGSASAPASRTASANPLQEGLHLRSLQQQVNALHKQLAAKEGQLAEQAAGAAAELAEARREFDALAARAAEAEAAAEAVLNLRASGAGLGAAAEGNEHQQCREAIEGVFAQMWRERLARQRAQAQVADLRTTLSEQHSRSFAATGTAASGAGAEEPLDEALMRGLEAEMARADHLQEELRHYKAHQVRLQQRVEQLELQLAQYTSLLTAAEGVDTVPSLAGCTASPRGCSISPRSGGPLSPKRGAASPVQTAITALSVRKTAEEMAALRQQLKQAKATIAGVRRRERDAVESLKANHIAQQALEQKHMLLAAGLVTLQKLLARHSSLGSLEGQQRSPGAQGRTSGSGLGESAMALLSALLKTLQAQEVGDAHDMVSPQASDLAEGGAMGAAQGVLGLEMPAGGGAEEALLGPLDPLDVFMLLPDGGADNTYTGTAPSSPTVQQTSFSPGAAAGAGSRSPSSPLQAGLHSLSAARLGGGSSQPASPRAVTFADAAPAVAVRAAAPGSCFAPPSPLLAGLHLTDQGPIPMSVPPLAPAAGITIYSITANEPPVEQGDGDFDCWNSFAIPAVRPGSFTSAQFTPAVQPGEAAGRPLAGSPGPRAPSSLGPRPALPGSPATGRRSGKPSLSVPTSPAGGTLVKLLAPCALGGVQPACHQEQPQRGRPRAAAQAVMGSAAGAAAAGGFC